VQARSPLGTPFSELFATVYGARTSAVLMGMYFVSAVFGIATIGAGLGQYFSYFGVSRVVVIEILAIAGFLAVNLVGIALSGMTENVLTIVKVVAIVAITAALAPFVRVENLRPDHVASVPALAQVVVIVYWSFSGFEISAIPVAETKDPGQIARALLVVMTLVCVVYFGLNVALIGAVGAGPLAASQAPVATAVGHFFGGSGAGALVAALAIVTMLSALNAYIVAASRVLQNVAAMLGMAAVARLSRRGAPAAALFVSCALPAMLLLFSNQFSALAIAAVLATLIPYVAICLAAFVLLKTRVTRAVSLFGAVLTAAILVLYIAR
jgi:amino acid transporter